MKKILVILLVLAVTTGVFAQGEWTFGALVNIGSRVDLNKFHKVDENGTPDVDGQAPIGSAALQYPYQYYTATQGIFNLGYENGPVNVALEFNTGPGNTGRPLPNIEPNPWGMSGDQGLAGTVTATGDKYKFQMKSKLMGNGNVLLAGGGETANTAGITSFDRLWGWYKLVNDMVHLEVAFASADQAWWVSDRTGAFGSGINVAEGGTSGAMFGARAAKNLGLRLFLDADAFTHVDHNNYFLADLTIGGLELGILIPNIFAGANSHDSNGSKKNAGLDNQTVVRFVDDALKQAVFGVKFQMSPIEFAVQMSLDDYGTYFGGKAFFGPITVGLSFMGMFPTDYPHMKAGARVDFNGGSFGAGVKAFIENQKTNTNSGETLIGVEPVFFINAIPAYMTFILNGGFYFDSFKINGDKDPLDIYWAIEPVITWNFRGTGATGNNPYHGLNTGFVFRYRILAGALNADGSSDNTSKYRNTNALDLLFKFGL